jgi:phenylacetaldehyde dehydrogenase
MDVEAISVNPTRPMYVAGVWTAAASGRTLDVINPATGEVIGTVAAGGKAEIDAAVASARKAFDQGDWTGLSPAARARLLLKLADLIEANVEQIARGEVADNGMPLSSARQFVGNAADTVRYFAGWATKIHGLSADFSSGLVEVHAYTRREPVGVVGAIIPWNSPFSFACSKLAVALAAGCTCVLKPAEETPLGALRLAQFVEEAGIPAGVVHVVTGTGEEAGAALAAHPDVDKIAFTGSTDVGRSILRGAADSMKRVTLELGGKSPVVVFEDADIERAIRGAANGIFLNAGQICMAGSRIYVHRKQYARLLEGIADIARRLKVGDGMTENVQMGPLISAPQRDRVMGYVEEGIKSGAELVAGGHRLGERGFFVEPTVMTGAAASSPLMREEIFGPVAAVMAFDDLDEVASLANDTSFGLAAAIWTQDISKAHRLAKKLQAGTVWLNCQLLLNQSLPFGGFKHSGLGREHGWEGMEAYLQTKTVIAAL